MKAQRAQMSNEAIALNNVKHIRGEALDSVPDDPSKPSWLTRRLYDLGVLEMVTPSTKPPGFFLNYSTAAFYILVIATIAGGFWFTYDRIATANFEKGQEVERRIQQEKEMNRLRQDVLLLQKTKEAEQKEAEQEGKK